MDLDNLEVVVFLTRANLKLIGAVGEMQLIPCCCELESTCKRCVLINRIEEIRTEISKMLNI